MAGGLIEMLFQALQDQPGVRIKGQSLMVGDKMFAYAKGDDLVIKLPSAQVQTLLRRKGFAPHLVGKNTMAEWVVVTRPSPAGYTSDLPLLRDAIEFVTTS